MSEATAGQMPVRQMEVNMGADLDDRERAAQGAFRDPAGDQSRDPALELFERVGERVRHARALKNLPRRVLSEISGVSPRYLAQLEGGAGNISIGLLARVASALDLPLERLLGEEDPWSSEVLRARDLFAVAAPEVRARVLSMLEADCPQGARAARIALIGLRGAGKSTLGRAAAQRLGLPFVELNQEITEATGMPVAEIMALYGPEGYRQLEAEALARVIAAHERMVLAVGGGLVAEAATFETLLAGCHTIWLRAAPEDHMARVRAQGDLRPMAGHPEAMAQLRTILRAREALYARAHAEVDTGGARFEASLASLLEVIASAGFLD